MDFKKSTAQPNVKTLDIRKVSDGAENIYQAVVVCAKRANQISVDIKQELSQKLEEFASYTDNLEEVFDNREQIEISRYYERLPKPTAIAIEEYLSGELYFRNPEEELDESEA
ncbi:MAG: DNA-directed RNA polymerase subunit omega [Bacteroidales bacterium]|jgi:DNA-directed RNA polymerase subunit K/omega